MPKTPRVMLLKQVKINGQWRHARALFDSKGRVRRDHVRVNGKDENHPEGSYFIEWWDRRQAPPRTCGRRCPGCRRKGTRQSRPNLQHSATASSRQPPNSNQRRNVPHCLSRSTGIWTMSAITDPCEHSAPTGLSSNPSRHFARKHTLTTLNVRTFSTSPRTA